MKTTQKYLSHPVFIISLLFISLAGALIFLVAFSFSANAAGNTYYVSTNGSDSNTGTSDSPFRTIQYAADTATAGDTVIVKDGTYNERVILNYDDSFETYKSENLHRAKVSAFSISTYNSNGVEYRSNDIILDGFDITNTNGWSGIWVHGDNIEITNNRLSYLNKGIQGSYIAKEYDPDNSGYQGYPSWSKNVKILNNEIFNTEQGILAVGDSWLVEGNEVRRPTYYGIDDADYSRFFGHNHVFRRNYFHGATPESINQSHTDGFQHFFVPTTNILIEENIVQGFGQGVIMEADPDLPDAVHDITIRNNVFIGAHQPGDISVEHFGSWGIVMDDKSGSTEDWGIDNVFVYNNLFLDNKLWGVGLRGGSSGEVKNNIFYNVAKPYHWPDDVPTQGESDNCTSFPEVGNEVNCPSPENFSATATFDNNIIYLNESLWGPAGNNSILADPKLSNRSTYVGSDGIPFTADDVFALLTDSPAIEAGDLVNATRDILGRTRPGGNAYDIGPLEYDADTENPEPPTVGLSFEAEDGLIESPLQVSSSTVYQTTSDDGTLTNSGKAEYVIDIPEDGNYIVKAVVDAPSTASNSYYINFDSENVSSEQVWDINLTSGLAERQVSWRGTGTVDENQFDPKIFNLTAGEHTLILRGREANTIVDKFTIEKVTEEEDPDPSTKFAVGDRVEVSTSGTTLNVRSGAGISYSIVSEEPDGSAGQVVGGPSYADDYWWWEIDFDSGAGGWAVENFLIDETAEPTGSIDSFKIVETNSDTVISDLSAVSDGRSVSISPTDYPELSVLANTTGDIKSVVFSVDGSDVKTEDSPEPYSIAGDSGSDIFPWPIDPGVYQVTARGYSAESAGGTMLSEISFTLEYEDDVDILADKFSILSSDDSVIFGGIINGDDVTTSADSLGDNFKIKVEFDEPNVDSVVFTVNTRFGSTVNGEPYIMSSSEKDRGTVSPLSSMTGTHIITATAYSRNAGKGEVLDQISFSLTITGDTAKVWRGLFANVLDSFKSLVGN